MVTKKPTRGNQLALKSCLQTRKQLTVMRTKVQKKRKRIKQPITRQPISKEVLELNNSAHPVNIC